MKKLFAPLFLFLSTPAWAESDISYSYFEADFTNFGISDREIVSSRFETGVGVSSTVIPVAIKDDAGYRLNFSLALNENFYLFGNYSDGASLSFPFCPAPLVCVRGGFGNEEWKHWNAGVGYHFAISDKADMLFELGYADMTIQISVPIFDGLPLGPNVGRLTDSGVSAAWGVRATINDWFEAGAKLKYAGLSDALDGGSVELNGLFSLGDSGWGANLFVDKGSDFTQYGAGIRYSF